MQDWEAGEEPKSSSVGSQSRQPSTLPGIIFYQNLLSATATGAAVIVLDPRPLFGNALKSLATCSKRMAGGYISPDRSDERPGEIPRSQLPRPLGSCQKKAGEFGHHIPSWMFLRRQTDCLGPVSCRRYMHFPHRFARTDKSLTRLVNSRYTNISVLYIHKIR